MLLGADRVASAASVTSITYDITGGDFGSLMFPTLQGPITGVSITYTPPGGSISTPATCSGYSGCGRLDWVITGPSAMTTFYNYAHIVNIGPNHFLAFRAITPFVYQIAVSSGSGTGHIGFSVVPTVSALVFNVGNEVRLPSPTPTPPTPTPSTPTPPTATPPTPTPTPTPPPATGAMFRILRSWHDDINTTTGGEMYSTPFYNPFSEPNPGPPGYYPPAAAVFTSMGGFTIPRGVIHFGVAAYDQFTTDCFGVTCVYDYVYATYYYSYYNYKGVFLPNNPYAASTTVTLDTPTPATSTTQFSGRYDFSRRGSIKIFPGPNRFGGTMRYFWGPNQRVVGFADAYSPCCETAELHPWRTGSGMLDFTESQPQQVGETYVRGEGTRAHTYFTTLSTTPPYTGGGPLTRMIMDFVMAAPWTTGKVSVYQSGGPFVTTAVQQGSDNRNASGGMGTVSLVIPRLTHRYETRYNPGAPPFDSQHKAVIWKMQVKFLPEPSGFLAIGAGILGMVAVYRLRNR